MSFPSDLESYRQQIEQSLPALLAELSGPDSLQEAMLYSLKGGGKRLRAVLVLATAALVGDGGPDALPAAAAVEMIHTYSLIHDDLPCMDDDDLRRGQPSSHKRFGEAMAVLAGDGLQTGAFQLLAAAYADDHPVLCARLVGELARAAGPAGMVGGQVLDTLEDAAHLDDLAGLRRMHAMKTGALIRVAVRTGAMLRGANVAELDALTRYGENIGLAFQIADDILDVVGDSSQLGKTTGKDAAQGKTTFVSLLGLEKSRKTAEELVARAITGLDGYGLRAEALRELARFIVERTH